ncbi:dTDP-4-dehydrorhamnose reductase [Congregibacter variabilis]|uniref:dTDP-4-dehydrorhamnose reductase n=1 Tax=Congregibacter variabilis TaxID=3081200 RepID=A0ABZ0I0K1_9GAMM|nr:dTDP-4-dehydrorhamnose reductase [Congregibacter sp. IMCC43200]
MQSVVAMRDKQLSKVMVTGAGGQLGSALCSSAPSSIEVCALTRSECDICDPAAVAAALDKQRPELLINAAAYTAVDRAEEESAAAFAANAEAPGILSRACAQRGIRFFHVSTDFVFDGLSSSPYAVDAQTSPLGVYGHSKQAGEQATLESGADALILRTGWVYSHDGQNFMRTMLRLHESHDEISVVSDQVGTPTDALSLAGALWAAAHRRGLSGIYHWSDAGVCSWYDFAVAIGEEAKAQGLLSKVAVVKPIRTQDYPTPAQRPAYSVLDKTRSWLDLEIPPTHWRSQLRAVLTRLKEADHA